MPTAIIPELPLSAAISAGDRVLRDAVPEPAPIDSKIISGSDHVLADEGYPLEYVMERVVSGVRDRLRRQKPPTATYRLQFHRHFTFRDAAQLVPYLHELGISHVYASPYLRARKGSTHGYDIVDHAALNPELGTPGDFEQFVDELRRCSMGHLLDVVPNHMGVGSEENTWWQDVLKNGPSSKFAAYFDIDWQPLKDGLQNKVLLPVLGDQYGRVLEDQQLQLQFAEGEITLKCYERMFPIDPQTYGQVLRYRLEELQRRLGAEAPPFLEYQSILTALGHLPSREETAPERQEERYREQEVIRRRLAKLCEEYAEVLAFINENVNVYNGVRGEAKSFDLLDQLLAEQVYRLCFWRVAADEINYRRFFDVNDLAAVCMENPEVFAVTHALILQLLDEERLDGLRIDHADGLCDPAGYLRRLQEARFLQLCRKEFNEYSFSVSWDHLEPALRQEYERLFLMQPVSELAKPLYVVVEKILERGEPLPDDWKVSGTTGYDFLNDVNGLFVDRRHAKTFSTLYRKFSGQMASFDDLAYHAKKLIMQAAMSSELNVLGHNLDRISERHRWSRDFTLHGLTRALREIVACFPIYRTYVSEAGVSERDRTYIEMAVSRAKRHNPTTSHEIFDFIREILLLRLPQKVDRDDPTGRTRFVLRFQQFTGPMMAKAVEDTTFYQYNRLLSLNEVGGSPDNFGISVEAFHRRNQERLAVRPQTMLTTATHDTKRGEDVRARINVLSEIPDVWKRALGRWTRWNKRLKSTVDGNPAPSRNDEYFLYQTLLGAWPAGIPSAEECRRFVRRIQEYMVKALREAKVVTSWVAPHAAYEQATCDFVGRLLENSPKNPFLPDFENLARTVAACGIWNSLSQTLLKLTSPGVPDLYQGTELWDLTLVDPDNRGAVDFALRREHFAAVQAGLRQNGAAREEFLRHLVEDSTDGRIKLAVVYLALQMRRAQEELFSHGEYVPLAVHGARGEHVCAFARLYGSAAAIVVAPRLTAHLGPEPGAPPLGEAVWQDTQFAWPVPSILSRWRDVFTDRVYSSEDNELAQVGQLLGHFPVALLTAHSADSVLPW